MDEIRLIGEFDFHAKESLLAEMLEEHKGNLANVHLWIEGVGQEDDELAKTHGFVGYRDLHKLTCELPLTTEPANEADLVIRAFKESDTENFLKVQNRAFEWHPEEANMDRKELSKRFSQPWYDPNDFLLLFEDSHESELMGFCWTKVHKSTTPPSGEIYMVGIDSAFQGRSLGEPLTRAGFNHLADRGLTVGILYVEANNHAANKVYERIGMTLASVNRAYKYLPN